MILKRPAFLFWFLLKAFCFDIKQFIPDYIFLNDSFASFIKTMDTIQAKEAYEMFKKEMKFVPLRDTMAKDICIAAFMEIMDDNMNVASELPQQTLLSRTTGVKDMEAAAIKRAIIHGNLKFDEAIAFIEKIDRELRVEDVQITHVKRGEEGIIFLGRSSNICSSCGQCKPRKNRSKNRDKK